MKVIIGAALLWILARHSFGTYLGFATIPAKKGSTE
jgi:hypothetical protein